MSDFIKELYNEILKLTALNRHTDGSHEVKSLEIEQITTTIHNLWVNIQSQLTTAKKQISQLKNDNEFQEQRLGWAETAKKKHRKSIRVRDNAFDALAKMEEKVSKQLAAAQEREKNLCEFARHVLCQYCWDMPGSDKIEPDGGDIQDAAELFGLIESHIATAEDVDDEFDDFEVGDKIFKFSDVLKENKP